MPPDKGENDPQEYSMSTFIRLNHIRRFVTIDSRFQPPLTLAKGHTTKENGKSCKTKSFKKCKSSHVDWWLYEGAEPWQAFKETTYEYEFEHFPDRQ